MFHLGPREIKFLTSEQLQVTALTTSGEITRKLNTPTGYPKLKVLLSALGFTAISKLVLQRLKLVPTQHKDLSPDSFDINQVDVVRDKEFYSHVNVTKFKFTYVKDAESRLKDEYYDGFTSDPNQSSKFDIGLMALPPNQLVVTITAGDADQSFTTNLTLSYDYDPTIHELIQEFYFKEIIPEYEKAIKEDGKAMQLDLFMEHAPLKKLELVPDPKPPQSDLSTYDVDDYDYPPDLLTSNKTGQHLTGSALEMRKRKLIQQGQATLKSA